MARTLILGQRRIEIGRALQTCMIQKGSYESTSVKDIARQAGLTTSLVHYYFNSKDKILFFISDIALHEVSNQLDELLHLKNNEDRIVLLRETLFDQEQNKFILMLYTLSLSMPEITMPEIKEMIIRHRNEQIEAIEAYFNRKTHFTGDPPKKAKELLTLFEAILIQSALVQSDDIIPMIISIFEQTL